MLATLVSAGAGWGLTSETEGGRMIARLCECKEQAWELRCIKCGGVLPSCLDCKHYEGKINQLKAQRDELLEALERLRREPCDVNICTHMDDSCPYYHAEQVIARVKGGEA